MNLAPSTRWHRTHGRPTKSAQAVSIQYLTEEEEVLLWDFIIAKRAEVANFRLRHDEINSVAQTIRHRRHSDGDLCIEDQKCSTKKPDKNWSSAFFARRTQHQNVKRRHNLARSGATDMSELLKDLSPMIQQTKILHENVYHLLLVGGVMLKGNILRELMKPGETGQYLKRTPTGKVLTIVECMSLQHEVLSPLVVWPATTGSDNSFTTSLDHCSTNSAAGQFDVATFSDWLEQIFDPQTCIRARGRPRFLILGRLADFFSKRTAEFCQKRKIVVYEARGTTAKKLPPGAATYDEFTASTFKALQRAYTEKTRLGMSFWENYRGARKEAFQIQKEHMAGSSELRAQIDPEANAQSSTAMTNDKMTMTTSANTSEHSVVSPPEGRPLSVAHYEFLASVVQHDLACIDMDEAVKDRINHMISVSKALLSCGKPRGGRHGIM